MTMAENTTIARPYARAVFELARENDALAAWSAFLDRARKVTSDERIRGLIGNPAITRAELGELLVELCRDETGEQGANFLRLIAENDRVDIVAEIAEGFEALRAEAENVIDVQLTSATPLDDSQRDDYIRSLRRRLGRDVRLHCDTDPTLLGGAVIRAGDLVIDGSLLGRLQRLAGAVTH
jgi:F-type H+-transporting ATPase subunit delta